MSNVDPQPSERSGKQFPSSNEPTALRLQWLIRKLGKDKSVSASGKSWKTLYRYMTGGDVPVSAIVGLAEAAGVQVSWLATGEGEPEGSASNALTVSRDEPIMVDDGRIAIVPRIGTRADAGPGALVQVEDGDVSYFGFRSDWLRAQGVEPKAVRLLDIHGDSMLPTFKDGDTVLVDTGINRIVDSRIYAIVFAGLLIVKRVILKRDGSVVLRSDNRDLYEDESVPSGEVGDLHIAGRVFWCGGSI